MRFNNLSVRVVGRREIEGGYVEMQHGQQYSLALRNETSLRYNASVRIDGREIGTWRINAHSSSNLTYAPNDPQHGKFTFYKAGTQESLLAGVESGNDNNGLITVVFTPEYQSGYTYTATTSYTVSNTTSKDIEMPQFSGAMRGGYSSGGTGLSGHSSQQYGSASYMKLDYENQTVINLRLVCIDNNTPRPLAPFSTPVPPPIR